MTAEAAQNAQKADTGQTAEDSQPPLLEADAIGKYFGSVQALHDVSLSVRAGQVTCVLGDNGAGKSTLIKILSGVFPPDAGQVRVNGEAVRFHSPRDARAAGIATVFQDLAMVPLMAVWRNFFLGSEPTRGWGPWRRFDVPAAREQTRAALAAMGVAVRDPDQPAGTLSGGERQAVAIARAVHFGARVLILDEPTSALGVKQAGAVLRLVAQARERGLGVVFITHNPHHAHPVGDRFAVLNRGRLLGDYPKAEITRPELVRLMSGGAELDALSHELEQIPGIEGIGTERGRPREDTERGRPREDTERGRPRENTVRGRPRENTSDSNTGLQPESGAEPPPAPAPAGQTPDEPRPRADPPPPAPEALDEKS